MNNEQHLIGRAQRGDQAAFVALVALYERPIYNLCYRLLGDAREAEDASQETFLRAYQHSRTFDTGRSFKTWLFSIAGHYCIDRLRRRRWLWLSIDDEGPVQHPALHAPGLGPEDSAVRSEGDAAVQALLERLSPRDRQAVVLRYWHELSYAEIARLTGDSLSAVKSRLHRAREHLAGLVHQDQFDALDNGAGFALRTIPASPAH